MKIYLAGSIAGGREFAKNLRLICDELEKLGHTVLTKNFVVLTSKSDTRANKVGMKKIMIRDKNLVKESDVVIAEVSQTSYGVGYEHAYAESLGKPILLLRHNSLKGKKYSAFLEGGDYEKFQFEFYDEGNIKTLLQSFFK